jgi:hypothetical protein
LPYGDDIKNEWGSIIYEKDGRLFLTDPLEGTPDSVPFRLAVDKEGVLYTRDGYKVMEVTHTHVNSIDGYKFSRSSRGDLGDVGLAEKYNVNITLRFKNTIRIYEPATMRPIRSRYGGFENHPGRELCSSKCF